MKALLATATLLVATSLLAQTPKAQVTYFDNTGTAAGSVLENVLNPQPVTIDMTPPGARGPARMTMKEGTLARIDSERNGQAYAVAVRVVDEPNAIVEARFFEVTKSGDGKERLRVLTTFNLQAGNAFKVPYSRNSDGGPRRMPRIESNATAMADDFFTFDLVGINVHPTSASKACGSRGSLADTRLQSLSAPYTPVPLLRCSDGNCCIGCDGWQVCACAVEFCGISCCCNDCCG
jgi:hypothetical protein